MRKQTTQQQMATERGSNEKRCYPRARVSLFADCAVVLGEPVIAEAIVEDISVGGLRIELTGGVEAEALGTNTRVRGEISSDNPAMQMSFTGVIAWRQAGLADGLPTLRLGISFDKDVVLSEVLHSLQPLRKAGGV